MRSRLIASCALSLSLIFIACNKAQTPGSPPTPARALPAAPAALAPPVRAAHELHFTGEVKYGQQFERVFASDMMFRLAPYAGSDSGWTIRIAPGTDSAAASIDCIGAVETPRHGDTKIEIEPPEHDASKNPAWRQREFEYVAAPADCKTAWDLMNQANYANKLSEKEREDASAKLGQIPSRHAKFTILDARLGPATPQNEHGVLEWLKFQVDVSSPDAPVQSSTAKSEVKTEIAAPGKGIRGVDLKGFLETHYREVQPELQAEPNIDVLKEECGENQEPIRSLAPFQYDDLDGDGLEEAVYQGFTCMSGTAGVDFFGVLKMMPDGKIIALPIEAEKKEFKGRSNIYDGLRGHLSLTINNARLAETYPVYTGNEANCCPEGGTRKFLYRWNGQQFVLDDIIEVPPEKADN